MPGLLRPIFDDAVTLFFAANESYAPMTAVAIKSVIDHASPERNYDIIVGTCGGIGRRSRRRLERMSQLNIIIRVIDMSYMSDLHNFYFLSSRFSSETYARFFIPSLFGEYSKVVWLDSDMVIMRDVADLYDIDIGDNWWGAARDNFGTFGQIYYNHVYKLTNGRIADYFQAGVMIWNVKKCIEDNVEEKLFNKFYEMGPTVLQDQDNMNAVAKGEHIYFLSEYWNSKAFNNDGTAAIIHYTTRAKPWNLRKRLRNHIYFWYYAKKTKFYGRLCRIKFWNIVKSKARKLLKWDSGAHF